MIYGNPKERPPVLTPILKNVPQELRDYPQWVYWKWTWDKSRKAWSKPPYKSRDTLTSVTTYQNFREFDKVRDFVGKSFDGVGFVFTDTDGFVGIDIDDCFNDVTGGIHIIASCILTAADTYAEYSPSGKGIKLFFKLGTVPALHSHVFSVKGLKIEIYSEKRYFTVTGHVCKDFEKPLQTSMDNFLAVMEIIHNDSDKSEKLESDSGVTEASNATEMVAPVSKTQSVSLDSASIKDSLETAQKVKEELFGDGKEDTLAEDNLENEGDVVYPAHPVINLILESTHSDRFKALWAGDLSGFDNDQNRGDLSLCWLLAKYGYPQPAAVDTLFRQSGLYRGKWDRPDYRDRTIRKAIDMVLKQESDGKRVLRHELYSTDFDPSDSSDASPSETPPPDVPPSDDTPPSSTPLFNCKIPPANTVPFGDTWNAETFYLNNPNDYYWVEDWQRWYVYLQTRWQLDGTLRVKRGFNLLIRELTQVLLESGADNDDTMLKHLVSSLSSKNTNAALEILKPMMAVESSIFDGNPDLLNCPNGTVNLRTGKIQSHDYRDHINQQVLVPYKFDDFDGEWTSFLAEVQPDIEMRQFLQRAVGYTLTGYDSEQCLFYLYGVGKNGKTTFIEPVRHLLEDYGIRAPSQMLQMDNVKTGNDYSVPEIRGKRMVVHSEVVAHKKLDEGLVKDLTGSEGLVGRRAYAKEFDRFQSVSKHWLYGNHLVRIQGVDEGIWRRIRLVKFPVQIENPDKDLIERLKSEEEQKKILTWAVIGAQKWYEQGLNPPEGVVKATADYRAGQDDVKDFLERFTERVQGGFVSSADLWTAYNDSFDGALSRRAFAQRVIALHGESTVDRVDGRTIRGWGGLYLV